jgi:hypothetical protein
VALGVTGMAWAADSAVPGDWNYGLDRALESIGIGAGGSTERFVEQISLTADEPTHPIESATAEGSTVQPDSTDGPSGFDRALTAATQHPRQDKDTVYLRRRAPEVLLYLNTTDHVDGAVVAAIARADSGRVQGGVAENRPEDTRPPGDEGKPENTGASEDRGIRFE